MEHNLYIGDVVHSNIFPINFRMLIIGQSGCGKTCLLMRLLLEPNLLNYDKLCFCQIIVSATISSHKSWIRK